MDNRTYTQARDEVVECLQSVVCNICEKVLSISASTSNEGPDVCTCQPIMCNPLILTTPNGVSDMEQSPTNSGFEDCNELLVPANRDYDTLCGSGKTYCKIVGCLELLLVKDLIQHLRTEHASMLITARNSFVEFDVLEDFMCHVIPLYVFDTIFWEKIYFGKEDFEIVFIHESPSTKTSNLKAIVILHSGKLGMTDTVRVMNFDEDHGRERIIIPYAGINMFKDVELGSEFVHSGTGLTVKHSLKIIKLDLLFNNSNN